MEFCAEEWGRKGATLSDKTARAEYGLTHRKVRLREKVDLAVPQRTRRKLAAVLRLSAAPISALIDPERRWFLAR